MKTGPATRVIISVSEERLAFAGDEATIDGAEYYGTIVNGETGETLAILWSPRQ